MFGASSGGSAEQVERVDADRRRQSFHRLQRQVAFAALDPAHVGAVHTKFVGECFLTETEGFTVAAEVATEGPLQVAFHTSNRGILLLEGLHTHE